MSKKSNKTRGNPKTTTGLRTEAKVLLGLGVFLALGAAILLLTRPGEPEESAVSQTPAGSLLASDSYSLGSPDARVTIVEFLDPECESCRAMHPTVKRVMEEYGDDVYLVVRYFPLHNNSVLAAKTLEAAGTQGKYWEMLDLLFANQTQWGEKSQPQADLFRKYARDLGLDMTAFERDFGDAKFEAKVSRDKADGIAAGVKGTPTFFINGKLAGNGLTFSQFASKIDAELQ